MKKLILFFVIINSGSIAAQRKLVPTDSLFFQGAIKQEKIISITDLEHYTSKKIDDLVITNQHGEVKDTIRQLKVVSFKSLLDDIEIVVDKPKFLNEYYFVLVAADGYKAVFSWNEIFNTEIGNNLYLVTEMNGKKSREIPEHILFISTKE